MIEIGFIIYAAIGIAYLGLTWYKDPTMTCYNVGFATFVAFCYAMTLLLWPVFLINHVLARVRRHG